MHIIFMLMRATTDREVYKHLVSTEDWLWYKILCRSGNPVEPASVLSPFYDVIMTSLAVFSVDAIKLSA